jgi:hypothetical protein
VTARDFQVTVSIPASSITLPRPLSRILAVFAAVFLVYACGQPSEPSVEVRLLSPAARSSIDTLYLDEFRAAERYAQVLREFGAVLPFVDLLPVQGQRLSALGTVYRAYAGFEPPDPYAALHFQEVYRDLAGACEVSAEFEQRTADRYGRVVAMPLPAAVAGILRANLEASLNVDVPRTAACY